MILTLSDERKPPGRVTWIAHFRDGTEWAEFGPRDEHGQMPPEVSADSFFNHPDLDMVMLVPVYEGQPQSIIRILVKPGETVKKKWIRTGVLDETATEQATIDSWDLISDLPIHHFMFADGSVLISTDEEPPL